MDTCAICIDYFELQECLHCILPALHHSLGRMTCWILSFFCHFCQPTRSTFRGPSSCFCNTQCVILWRAQMPTWPPPPPPPQINHWITWVPKYGIYYSTACYNCSNRTISFTQCPFVSLPYISYRQRRFSQGCIACSKVSISNDTCWRSHRNHNGAHNNIAVFGITTEWLGLGWVISPCDLMDCFLC